jgi:hypothetical protein
VLGVDDPSTLTSMSNLAPVLQDQGKYEQAEGMGRRAQAGREKVLGVDHPQTLTSVYCLVYLLNARQDLNGALKLYQRTLVGFNRALGPLNPTSVACQGYKASLLEKMF